jgi:hypothetical protein
MKMARSLENLEFTKFKTGYNSVKIYVRVMGLRKEPGIMLSNK